MSETLSIRLASDVKTRLEALSSRTNRSKSLLAAEAIAAYVETEEWQLGEIDAGLEERDRGQAVSHRRVSKWLRSWGRKSESKPPR